MNDYTDSVRTGAEPSNEGEYLDWFAEKFGPRGQSALFLKREQEFFENAAGRLLADFKKSAFWHRVLSELRDSHAVYDSTYGLLAHSTRLDNVVHKSWDSIVLKSFRRNVLDNANWPDPPDKGWTTHLNWFETVSDVVRTTIVVRYLDGVEIVHKAVAKAAAATTATVTFDYEARDEGYYALHITARLLLSFPSKTWERVQKEVPVEIQVCTQVQEVLRTLTHKFYEASRLRPKMDDAKWQWDYRGDQFAPNYLGHILHYADGVIMNIRHEREQGAK